jgi:hypothetical protein
MKIIPLTQGKIALVDDEDYDRLSPHKWYAHNRCQTSYAQRWIENKVCMMHRIILSAPTGVEIDHIDGNGLNNQKSNLRVVTRRQNSQNLHGVVKTSKYVGVHRIHPSRKNCWRAEISVNNKLVSLGCYPSEEEAACAYNRHVDLLNEHAEQVEAHNHCYIDREQGKHT